MKRCSGRKSNVISISNSAINQKLKQLRKFQQLFNTETDDADSNIFHTRYKNTYDIIQLCSRKIKKLWLPNESVTNAPLESHKSFSRLLRKLVSVRRVQRAYGAQVCKKYMSIFKLRMQQSNCQLEQMFQKQSSENSFANNTHYSFARKHQNFVKTQIEFTIPSINDLQKIIYNTVQIGVYTKVEEIFIDITTAINDTIHKRQTTTLIENDEEFQGKNIERVWSMKNGKQ